MPGPSQREIESILRQAERADRRGRGARYERRFRDQLDRVNADIKQRNEHAPPGYEYEAGFEAIPSTTKKHGNDWEPTLILVHTEKWPAVSRQFATGPDSIGRHPC